MEFMTHLFRFFMIFFSSFSSSDFTDESEGIPAEAITHGFSRIFGLWPMAGARYMLLLFFCHADFADDADFSSWEGFVPQISQIYTDFLWNLC